MTDRRKGWAILKHLNLDVQDKALQITGSFAILPALITWMRFLGAAAVILIIYRSLNLNLLFWVILVCAVSDYLDGWVARRLKRTSYPGKVMDFIADKLFISITLVALSFSLEAIDTIVAGILTAYHLLLLFLLAAISWSVHVPVVTITTGERLAILTSYLLLITAAGRLTFPQKHIFQSLYTPLMIIAILSAATGFLSYLRLLRRMLTRFLE